MSIITPLPPAPSNNELNTGTSVAQYRTFSVDDVFAMITLAVTKVINGAPGALDQLNELANALGNDPNFSVTVMNAIAAINGLSNGSGAPSNSLGKNGDFYVDTTNKLFYGPKTNGSWTSSFSLVGPAGTAGTQWFTGSAIPTTSNVPSAVNGDWYVKTDNYTFYRLLSGTWVIQFMIPSGSGNALLLATVL